MSSAAPTRRRLRRLLPQILGVVVVVAVFGLALPRFASYADVLDVVRDLSARQLAALAGVTVFNTITFAPQWMVALPGLSFSRALLMTQASTAASAVLPGGDAVGAGITIGSLRRWGFEPAAVVAAVVVMSALAVSAKVSLAIAGVVAIVLTGGDSGAFPLLTGLAVAVLVALAAGAVLALRNERATRSLGGRLDRVLAPVRRLLRRAPGVPVADRLVAFRLEAATLLRRRGLAVFIWELVGQLTVFVVLLVALRVLDVGANEVTALEAFSAWALTRLLTAIPITPGGLGVLELGLTAALVAAGGPDTGVVAAVLVYRVLTWAPPVILGPPSLLIARRLPPYPPERLGY